MTFVLSNGFKGLLLSSYVNIKYELAVKSMEDFVNNPSTEMIVSNIGNINYETENTQLLKKKAAKGNPNIGIHSVDPKVFSDDKDINHFKNGQTVIWCSTFDCPIFQILNPHLHFQYLEEPQYHLYKVLSVIKTHSHAKEINKL